MAAADVIAVGLQGATLVLAIVILRAVRRQQRQLTNLVNFLRGHTAIARANYKTIFDRLDKRGGWWR